MCLVTELKNNLKKLNFALSPVTVKFCFSKPENVEPVGKSMALCSFIKEAQSSHRKFYVTADDEDCVGRMVMGMIDVPPLEGSGQAGVDFEVFRTTACKCKIISSGAPSYKRCSQLHYLRTYRSV